MHPFTFITKSSPLQCLSLTPVGYIHVILNEEDKKKQLCSVSYSCASIQCEIIPVQLPTLIPPLLQQLVLHVLRSARCCLSVQADTCILGLLFVLWTHHFDHTSLHFLSNLLSANTALFCNIIFTTKLAYVTIC